MERTQSWPHAYAALCVACLCCAYAANSSARHRLQPHGSLFCFHAWHVCCAADQPMLLLVAWWIPHACALGVCSGGLAFVLALETWSCAAPAAMWRYALRWLESAPPSVRACPSR
eukprot:1436998-Amphidinium_carterae.1